jgi:hypothetical protein
LAGAFLAGAFFLAGGFFGGAFFVTFLVFFDATKDPFL